MKHLIVLLDSGDTLIDESSQKFDARGIVTRASFIPGALETLKELNQMGFTLALVADGETESFENVYNSYKAYNLFTTKTISQEVGVQKPNPLMFEDAFAKLGLTEKDKSRVVMVGNNLRKDILGANNFGITSIWLNWSPRYFHSFQTEAERPVFTIEKPSQLIDLLERLNNSVIG